MKDDIKDRGFDLRRFMMLSVRRVWILILGALAGGIFFGGFAYIKQVIKAPEPVYRNDSLYLISFTQGEAEAAQAQFNDYTWNDVLDTDAIAGIAASILGDEIDKAYVAASTTVPTMSDISMFHVYVEDTDPEKADQIQNALTLSLGIFPQYITGMESITVLDRGKAELVIHTTTITRWMVAGAIIGALAALIILAYVYIMDDTVRIAEDIKTAGGRCLGILFKDKTDEAEEERLQEAVTDSFKKVQEVRMIDPAGTAVSAEVAGKIKAMMPDDVKFNTGNKDAKVLLCVAAGSISIAELKRFTDEGNTDVVLCDASRKLHRIYYFYGDRKGKKGAKNRTGSEKTEE